MAKRLKSSNLLMGQVEASRAPKQDTLAGFYSDVSRGQTGAIQKKAGETTKATRGLAGELGLDQKIDDTTQQSTTTLGTKFKPTVDTTTGGEKTDIPTTVATVSATAGDSTDLAALDADVASLTKYLDDLGITKKQWEALSAEKKQELLDNIDKKRKEADEAITTAQKRLTEKKLGARGQASELEEEAKSYQNIIASEPGTSNIKALANLTKFYDMSKYGALESGIRQGELALARQEAQSDLAAQESAESQRSAAIAEYGKQSKELGQTLKTEFETAATDEEKKLKDFYAGKIGEVDDQTTAAQTALDTAKGKVAEQERVQFDTEAKGITEDKGYEGIVNVLKAISGRGRNNWLNTQGHSVLDPLKQKMLTLRDDAQAIGDNVLLSTREKTAKLKELNKELKDLRGQVAQKLTEFLADGLGPEKGTRPGDALDAAEMIVYGGFVNDLTPHQKDIIIRRLERDLHVITNDPNHNSSPEKLERIYRAVGGTKDIIGMWQRRTNAEAEQRQNEENDRLLR